MENTTEIQEAEVLQEECSTEASTDSDTVFENAEVYYADMDEKRIKRAREKANRNIGKKILDLAEEKPQNKPLPSTIDLIYNENWVEYAKKVNEKRIGEGNTIDDIFARLNTRYAHRHKPKSVDITLKEAKLVFWQICQKELEKEFLHSSKKPNYIIDEHRKWLFHNIVLYFLQDESCEFDLQKGLCFWGYTGSGKTMLMRICKIFCDLVPIEHHTFDLVRVMEVYSRFESLKIKSLDGLGKYLHGNCCFDDLGDDSGGDLRKSFGNEYRVFDMVLKDRYDKFVNRGLLTHFTTNLIPVEKGDIENELLNHYGDILYGRIKQMCNFVQVKGDSFR